jgi:hypothetical protein
MNDGLGFVFFILAPLFGLWPVGCVVGLLIVLLWNALDREKPADYAHFFGGGSLASAAAIGCGFMLVSAYGRDTDACLRYAWIASATSVATWIPWAVLACLPGTRPLRRRAIRAQAVLGVLFFVLAVLLIGANMRGCG